MTKCKVPHCVPDCQTNVQFPGTFRMKKSFSAEVNEDSEIDIHAHISLKSNQRFLSDNLAFIN